MKIALSALIIGICVSSIAGPRLAAGQYHFCVTDDEGEKCWLGPMRYEPYSSFKPGSDSLDRSLPQGNPCVEAYDRHTPKCEAYLNSLSHPSLAGDPLRAGNGRTECAVNSDETVTCTGKDAPKKVLFPYTLHVVKQLVMTYDQVCALDNAGVACAFLENYSPCFGSHEKFPPPLKSLGVPREIAASKSTVCGLTPTELLCYDEFHRRDVEPKVEVKLGDALFRLENLPDLFDWLLAHSYRKHAPIFEAAKVAFARADDQRDVRLLLLNALAPFAQTVDSEFYKTEVQPRFTRFVPLRNQEAGIHALSDIPRTAATEWAALQLLSGALRTMPGTDDLLAATGRALSNPQELPALQRSLAQARGTLSGFPEIGLVDSINAYLFTAE